MATSTVVNDIEYANGGVASQAYLAEHAVADEDGKFIHENYIEIEDYPGHTVIMEEQLNAGFHNSFYRGKNITDQFQSGVLYQNIANGTFKNLYVGDYFTANYNGTPTVFRIAGFNIMLRNGDTSMDKPHAVIVPDNCLENAPMNDTNTTEGGFSGSKMFTVTLPAINEKLVAIFGEHIFDLRELVSSEMNVTTLNARSRSNGGSASNWTWNTVKACLMTEIELMGTNIHSSSGYDTGTGKIQLPLFRLNNEKTDSTDFSAFWLRNITSSTSFCVYLSKSIGADEASQQHGVRPRFIIG